MPANIVIGKRLICLTQEAVGLDDVAIVLIASTSVVQLAH